MKEIISKFADKYKDIRFVASYCDIEDLDVYTETNHERNHLILCNRRNDLNPIRSTHAFARLFTECTDQLEFDGAIYFHELITQDDQFIVVIDLKTGDFTVKGHVRRSIVLEALDRLSTVLDAIKFYESQISVDTETLNELYPWLDFSRRGMNKDEFTIELKDSELYSWFVIYRDVYDITVSLDKKTLRAMKRHLPKKVRHRRNRQIAKTAARMNSKELTSFERLFINAKTGPIKKGDYEWLYQFTKSSNH